MIIRCNCLAVTMLFNIVPILSGKVTTMKPSLPFSSVSFLWIYQLPTFPFSKWPLNDMSGRDFIGMCLLNLPCSQDGILSPKSLHRFARYLQKYLIVASFLFCWSNFDRSNGANWKGYQNYPPHCVLHLFSPCSNINIPFLRRPHL